MPSINAEQPGPADQGRENSGKCIVTINTSLVNATAKRITILLVHTSHDAGHLRPDDDRRKHSAKNVTRKTSIASMPLPESTTSAATKERTRRARKSSLPPLLHFPLGPVELTGARQGSQAILLHRRLPPLLLGKRPPEEEAEGAIIDRLTCRPCQNGKGEGRHRGSHVTDRDCSSLRLGRTPQQEAPAASLSSLSSVPVGLRTTQALHHGCDAGLQRAPSRRSAARAEASSAAVAPVTDLRSPGRGQPWPTARGLAEATHEKETLNQDALVVVPGADCVFIYIYIYIY